MKTPYQNFLLKTIAYGVLSFITLLCGIFCKSKFFLVFAVIFILLSVANYFLAQKHKNDKPYLWSVAVDKAKEKLASEEVTDENGNAKQVPQKSKRAKRKELKEQYHSFRKQIEEEYAFDYSDQFSDDDEDDFESESD